MKRDGVINNLLHRRHLALLPLLLATSGCDTLRDDIQLGSPDSLWLLWLVPLLVAFHIYVFRTKTRLLRRFASAGLLPRLTAGVSRARQGLKAVLITIGLFAAVLALAEPRWGFTWEEVERQGVDILVALDVSDSMLVEDVESGGGLSRLERAKREITDLLRLLEGDRIGLVAFAGTAFLECPLTLDHGAAELFLDAMDTDLIPVKGTNLAEAIETSMRAFEGGNHTSQAIILITDGEDHSGRAESAAQVAAEAGVRIFTVGIGRDEGSPIPAPGGGFRRDRRGEIVLSKLDETTLRKIAGATGGAYVRSVTGDVDLEQIYLQGIKANLEDRELGSQRRKRWEERFQWLLALALAALMLEPLLSERRRIPAMPTTQSSPDVSPTPPPASTASGRATTGRVAALVLALLLGGVTTGQAQTPADDPYDVPADADVSAEVGTGEASDGTAKTPAPPPDDPFDAYQSGHYQAALAGFTGQQVERPEDPQLWLNIGASNYKIRDFEAADTAFHRAATSAEPTIRQQAFYNLGNSAFRQGKLEEAVEHYKAALDLDPDDEDAKFNLEYVRDEIRRRLEEAQKRQEQQQNQQQQQQNQDQQQQGQDGQQGQDEQRQDGQDQQQQDPQQGQNGEQQQDQQGQQDGQQQQGSQGPDRDQDGLPDETERQGANRTDPNNPDSDGDGLPDGLEDRNQNGQVDEGETDPNKADSDGDGTPDGQEAENQAAAQAAQRAAELAGEAQEGMTPEQAARYLQALEEARPEDQKRGKRVRAAGTEKDW